MKCEYCGKEFTQPHRRGRAQKYCSDECSYNADKDNKRIKYVGKRQTHCALCGVELPKYKTKFCSDACRRRYHNIQKGVIEDHGELTKTCPVCGKTFKTWKSRQIVCSTECSTKRKNRVEYLTDEQKEKRKEYDRQKYLKTHPNARKRNMEEEHKHHLERIEREKAEREKRRIEREKIQAERRAEKDRIKAENISKWLEYEAEHICCECGATFTAHYPTTKYCSNSCARKRHRTRKRYKDITIDKDITLRMLANRDHNQCQICGLFVDWSDYMETDATIICGDMYPSIDHITPISLGGLHSWDNVQLAHRKCNTRKGNKYVG